ncbi:MAG: DUF86 domain-containing protein [Cytophagaceae bacterium]|nr:DUF86 domain-containing protein [Cytophagaceae bacterium]
MQNYLLRLGLTRLVEIIGEAAGQLSRGLHGEFSEVEWVAIKGMRNILIHEYFGVDYKVLWSSIKQDVPVLKEKMEEILRQKFPDKNR